MSITVIHRELLAQGPKSLPFCRKKQKIKSILADLSHWMYIGSDAAWPIKASDCSLLSLQFMHLGREVNSIALRIREQFLELIGDLSLNNDSPEWWATHLAAKNLYPSLFGRICSLAAAQEAMHDGMLVVCETVALTMGAAELARDQGYNVNVTSLPTWFKTTKEVGAKIGWEAAKTWSRIPSPAIRRAPTKISEVSRLAFDRTPQYREQILLEFGVVADPAGTTGHRSLEEHVPFTGSNTTLFFTWVDSRSFGQDGEYNDPHFGELVKYARCHRKEIAFVPRIMLKSSFTECVKSLLKTNERWFFPDSWIDSGAWEKCDDIAHHYYAKIPSHLKLHNVKVAPLLIEYVDEHRRAQADALSYYELIKSLAESGVSPGRIIIPWEGQAWENSLIDAVRSYMPKTRIVGYDNVNFSKFALSLYPAKTELEVKPLPDRIVTNGETFAKILLEEGIPLEKVVSGCALRHSYLYKRCDVRSGLDSKDNNDCVQVLLAGSIDAAQTAEMINLASDAFGLNAEYKVIIKIHPACDSLLVSKLSEGVEGQQNISFSTRPISDLLQGSDAMLYTYSVVCYEALAAGVPPIFLHSSTSIDLDQLEPFSSLRWSARTSQELQMAVHAITKLSDSQRLIWRGKACAAVRSALEECTPDSLAAFFE